MIRLREVCARKRDRFFVRCLASSFLPSNAVKVKSRGVPITYNVRPRTIGKTPWKIYKSAGRENGEINFVLLFIAIFYPAYNNSRRKWRVFGNLESEIRLNAVIDKTGRKKRSLFFTMTPKRRFLLPFWPENRNSNDAKHARILEVDREFDRRNIWKKGGTKGAIFIRFSREKKYRVCFRTERYEILCLNIS